MASTTYKIAVKILPRKEVLDSQGRAVERLLSNHGQKLESCRVGKYVVLEVAADDRDRAKAKAQEMTEFVLYNPLIESYELEVL
jgi:phosphoribosylformylglycinamidine synthase PurS subunit